MFRTRSLIHKIALVIFTITALVVGLIFLIVVPQLTSSLENQRLQDLDRVATASSRAFESVISLEISSGDLNDLVRSVSDGAEAEVTLLDTNPKSANGKQSVFPLSNSRASRNFAYNQPLALRALKANDIESEISQVQGQRTAQVAVPLHVGGDKRPDWVVLYSRGLGDVRDTVSLIRDRVLIASAIALLVALAVGYAVASAMARRVKRLETAANKLAAGEQVDPLPVDSDDELGQLTRSFNEMQAQLAKVERARREFIATASHELRTPIFSLGGFVELLQDEDLDPETREEFLSAMSEQVARLQKLAVDLLDLSRIDAGSLELNPEEVNLGELARTIVGEFTPAVTQHRSELELALEGDEVQAWCDRERVAQIMRILLDNAVRHTPEGTRIRVSAARDNGAAELSVSDAGPGIRDSEQVFERFYTADAARGSGLGLAIAQELAERMQGNVTVRSAPGKTTFTLELPAGKNGGLA
jgi:signal transduction histidine kinase